MFRTPCHIAACARRSSLLSFTKPLRSPCHRDMRRLHDDEQRSSLTRPCHPVPPAPCGTNLTPASEAPPYTRRTPFSRAGRAQENTLAYNRSSVPVRPLFPHSPQYGCPRPLNESLFLASAPRNVGADVTSRLGPIGRKGVALALEAGLTTGRSDKVLLQHHSLPT